MGRLLIHANPVIANFGFQPHIVGVQNKQVGGFDRHVAIDAVGGILLSDLANDSALLSLVTLEASRGVIGGRALGSVRIVASRTRHPW